jgi:hypothetical protein
MGQMELRQGPVLVGPLFSEPMRVETVTANGTDTWSVGLVGGVREGPPLFCGHGDTTFNLIIIAVALKKFPRFHPGPSRRNTKTWLLRFRAYSRMRNLLKNFPLALMQPLLRWQIISDGDDGPRQQGANFASRAKQGGAPWRSKSAMPSG